MALGGNIIIRKDYWLVDGVPVYTVRLEEAALALGISKKALEKRVGKDPAIAHKGRDGLLRMRIRDINAIQGIGEGLEWERPTPPPAPERKPAPSGPGKVIDFRARQTQ